MTGSAIEHSRLCLMDCLLAGVNFTVFDSGELRPRLDDFQNFNEIRLLAASSEFKSIAEFTDDKEWFTDVYWKAF